MKYIVKNCPCYWYIGGDEGCDLDNTKACENITDCLIKQVIDRCNKDKIHKYDCKVSKDILDMFDIEEINK